MMAKRTTLPRARSGPWGASLAAARALARELAASPALRRVVAALVTIDAVLIGLHVARRYVRAQGDDLVGGSMLAITDDHSLGEIFGYLKLAVIVACFLFAHARSRIPIFAAAGFAFLVALLDELFLVHDTLGERIAVALVIPPRGSLPGEDVVQLALFAALGIVLALVLGVAFARSGPIGRGYGIVVAALLAVGACFVVGADLVHAASGNPFRGFRFALGLLEDGGEMVTLSVTCAVAVAIARRPPPPET